MIIPIRCFTCGKVIAHRWEPFSQRVSEGEPPNDVLDDLGVNKYCCRRMLMSHTELIDEILKFYMEKGNMEIRRES